MCPAADNGCKTDYLSLLKTSKYIDCYAKNIVAQDPSITLDDAKDMVKMHDGNENWETFGPMMESTCQTQAGGSCNTIVFDDQDCMMPICEGVPPPESLPDDGGSADGPCHLQDPSTACGGAAKGTCVDLTAGAPDTPAVGAPVGISLGAASKCECVFPNVGDNCESEQDPANNPCVKKAEGSDSGAACFNDGVCHPAKSANSVVWDAAVCICALSGLQCWGGLSCELPVDELCPEGTNSCLVRKKAVKGVCSEDPPCVPAFDSEPPFCLPPSLRRCKAVCRRRNRRHGS